MTRRTPPGMAAPVADGTQAVTLEYAPPSGTKVRDAAGNDAKAFPRTSADPAPALDATVTPDTRAPEVSGVSVEGTALRVMPIANAARELVARANAAAGAPGARRCQAGPTRRCGQSVVDDGLCG